MGKLIYGRNSVKDALENNLEITKLYVTERPHFNISNNVEVVIKTKRELDKMINENHQGFIAELKEFNYFSLESIFKDKPERVLILDHLQDPHNLGAILRSANAFGIKHIIIPKERSVRVTPTVLKVASGGFVGIKIILVGSLVDAVQKLKKNGFWVYATALENGVEIDKVSFNEPAVLIVGNEHKGVTRSLLKLSDQNIYIPMKGTVQSLNVSVATGILLFKFS